MNEYKWMIDVLMDMAAFAEKNELQKSYETLINSMIEVMNETNSVDHIGDSEMVAADYLKDNVIAMPVR